VKGEARFLFTARRMDATGTVLFEQATTAGAAPARLFADPSRDIEDVRADGKQIMLITKSRQDELSLVDLPAGTSRVLFPSKAQDKKPREKAPRIFGAAYAPDGARVYVATDDSGEKTHVLALDVRTGRELARYTEARAPGGTPQGLVTSPTAIAYVIDLGTTHELRVLDARTLAARPAAALPLGSEVPGAGHPNATSGLALSTDGKRVAIQWSTPSTPARVYLVDTGTGATTALTKSPKADAGTEIDVQVVRIPSFDKLEVPALVYMPKNASGKRPVVMSIHGGFPFASTARYDRDLLALLDAGFAVVEPNVRGSAGFGVAYESADNGVKKLEGVRDFGAVGRWIGAQPWADASKMAVMGASAGGYYTLMCLAHYPEMWRAGVALVPLYDLALAARSMDADLRKFLEDREFVPLSETGSIAALSPSTYVDRIRSPLFVYAGARDVRTPTEQIDELVRDVRARHGKIEYMRTDDAGHSRGDPKIDAQRLARVVRFLTESMK
jgi:dipeptidyl aminopeptidase/acylaminoacyl peptidase